MQLTGLWPFYENEDDSVVQRKVSAGERPLVPHRLPTGNRSSVREEQALIDVMQRGWAHNPNQRMEIFEAVRFLRAVMRSTNGSQHSAQ
jgi:hypothetical protein